MFTKAQLEALASGIPLAAVEAMTASAAPAGAADGSADEVQVTLTAMSAQIATLTAERDTAQASLTTVTSEKEALAAQLAEQTSLATTASADANTLKTIVANAVTHLSTAVGTKVDASAMSATDLVAAHADLSTKVTNKFQGKSLAATLPAETQTQASKPVISQTRLSVAKAFPIMN